VCDTATTTPAYSARSFASRLARGLCADVTTGRWVSSKLAAHCMRPKNQYLLSLPERALRSASALAAGLVREIGNVTLPKAVRRTRLYQTMVETTLRFLIQQVGQVEGRYPPEGKLAENFLLQRTLGDGFDLAGLAAFHASPVWVLAALADISGAGRQLVDEIIASLKDEGNCSTGTRTSKASTSSSMVWNGRPDSSPRPFDSHPSIFRDCARSGAP
jgi:hypothetical protein